MANVYPKDVQFLLADAVRQEAGGKLAVLGLYSGAVLLKDTLPKELPEGAKGMALPRLEVLVTIFDGYGRFNVDLRLLGPRGTVIGKGATEIFVDKKKDAAANVIFPIEPFPIPGFGTYRITMQLNRHRYEFKFGVGHTDPNARFPVAATSKKQKSPKESPGQDSAPQSVKAPKAIRARGPNRKPRP
jgi:hypothetical protein